MRQRFIFSLIPPGNSVPTQSKRAELSPSCGHHPLAKGLPDTSGSNSLHVVVLRGVQVQTVRGQRSQEP